MRRLLWILPLMAMGCGGIKNTNPLLGLAGSVDSSRYGFENSTMGWASIVAPASAVDSVFQSTQLSFFGAGGLGFHVTSMGSTDGTAARIGISALSPMPDLTGKTLSLWVYLPAAGAPSDSLPTYGQIIVWDGAGTPVYANGTGVNLGRDAWTKVSWKPIANTSGAIINDNRGYIDIGFNPSQVSRFGIKIGTAGADPNFSYTGSIFIDSVDW